MTQVGSERVREWEEQPQYPGAMYKDLLRPNRQLRQRSNYNEVLRFLEAEQAGQEPICETTIRNAQGGTVFRVSYKITDVVIEELCVDGHDWTEWSYDFMGGDIRRCRRCGESEQT